MREILEKMITLIIYQICFAITYFALAKFFLKREQLTLYKIGQYTVATGISSSVLYFGVHIGAPKIHVLISTLLLIFVSFKGSLLAKLWVFLLGSCMTYSSEIVIDSILDWFFPMENIQGTVWYIFSTFLETILMLGILTVIKKKFKFNRANQAVTGKQLMMVYIVTLTVAFLVYMIGQVYVVSTLWGLMIKGYIVIGINTCLMIGINESMSRKYYEYVNELIQGEFNKQLDYYHRLEEVNRETRAIKHDMKNHIMVMQNLLEQNKLGDLTTYLNKITNHVKKGHSIIHTGNTIIDAIVNEKYAVACENHIKMEVNMSVPEDISIDVVDLCIIVANSIDNAIEASNQVKEVEKRRINIMGKIKSGYLLFQVVNSMQEEAVNIVNNRVATSKLDKKNHGYGIENIRSSAEKYNGELKLSSSCYCFSLEVCINTRQLNECEY